MINLRLTSIIFCLLAVIGFSSLSTQGFTEEYEPLEWNEMQAYMRSLQNEVTLQEQRVQDIFRKMATSGRVLSAKDKIELNNAKTMIDVKQTLVNNFRGNPALKSPLVRKKLLSLLQMEYITPKDLSEFEELLSKEKAKMGL